MHRVVYAFCAAPSPVPDFSPASFHRGRVGFKRLLLRVHEHQQLRLIARRMRFKQLLLSYIQLKASDAIAGRMRFSSSFSRARW